MCRIEVTPSGILQFEKVAEPFFFDYLQSMEPIAVSDQMLYSGSEIQLNLTGNTFGFNSNAWIRKKDFGLTFSSSKTKDMSLSSVDWSIFSFQISGNYIAKSKTEKKSFRGDISDSKDKAALFFQRPFDKVLALRNNELKLLSN